MQKSLEWLIETKKTPSMRRNWETNESGLNLMFSDLERCTKIILRRIGDKKEKVINLSIPLNALDPLESGEQGHQLIVDETQFNRRREQKLLDHGLILEL